MQTLITKAGTLAAQATATAAFVYMFMLVAFWPDPLRLVLQAAKAVLS